MDTVASVATGGSFTGVTVIDTVPLVIWPVFDVTLNPIESGPL